MTSNVTKTEVIDLHILLERIRKYLTEERPNPPLSPDRHSKDDQLVDATEIRADRTSHERAALDLARRIGDGLRKE